MSQYELKFDLKINVGTVTCTSQFSDFTLHLGRVFGVSVSYFPIMSQYDPMFDFQ